MQVQASDVEGQLGLEHAEEIAHMIGGLPEGAGDHRNSAIAQFRERLGTRLVARMQREAVHRRLPRAQPNRGGVGAIGKPAAQPVENIPPQLYPRSQARGSPRRT